MCSARRDRFRDIQPFGSDEVAATAGDAPDVLGMATLHADVLPLRSAVLAQ
jgi:hypothetical protein